MDKFFRALLEHGAGDGVGSQPGTRGRGVRSVGRKKFGIRGKAAQNPPSVSHGRERAAFRLRQAGICPAHGGLCLFPIGFLCPCHIKYGARARRFGQADERRARLRHNLQITHGVRAMLQNYRVVSAIEQVEARFRFFPMEIPPHAAMRQHGDGRFHPFRAADLREDLGHVVAIGMAIPDE